MKISKKFETQQNILSRALVQKSVGESIGMFNAQRFGMIIT